MLAIHPIWSSNVSWESFRSPASPRWRDEQCSMTIFCTRWVCLNMSQEKKIRWFPTQLAILCGCLVRIVLETLRFGIMIQSVSKEFRTSQEVYSFYHQLYKACRNSFYWHWKSWLNTYPRNVTFCWPMKCFKFSHIFISNPLQNTKKNVGVVMRSQSIKPTTEETLSTQTPRYLTYWSKSAWSVLAVSSLRLVFGIFCWRTSMDSMDFVLLELGIANANIVKKHAGCFVKCISFSCSCVHSKWIKNKVHRLQTCVFYAINMSILVYSQDKQLFRINKTPLVNHTLMIIGIVRQHV